MSRSSACRQRTAGGSSVIGKFEKMMNGPVRNLVASRHQRLTMVRERRATEDEDQDVIVQRAIDLTAPANRRMVAAVRHSRSPITQESGRRAPQVARSLAADPLLDRPPEALPVVQGRQSPGKVKAEEPQEVGSVSARNHVQTDAETRQVLDAPIPRESDAAR